MSAKIVRLIALSLGCWMTTSAFGDVIYNNLTPNNQMAVASRPGSSGSFLIEAADDFVLSSPTSISAASFVGVLVPGTSGNPSITQVVAETYRVFPLDSNGVRTPNVPVRANSPSDVALATRDSASGQLTYVTTVLSPSFSVVNSVEPGGIHLLPNQTTGGSGPVTGQEVQINVTFSNAFNLLDGHYFFVPQVEVSNGGQFYWLSASRPIGGSGTTPFPTGTIDLQVWTRDSSLNPDWLRVGTDILGGVTPPTFNAAFSLEGTATPEPATIFAVFAGLIAIGLGRRLSSIASKRAEHR